MKIDLHNKNILVTGASNGIGKGIAEALGNSGAKIAIHYNSNQQNASELARQIGNGSEVFQADLSDANSCEKLFNDVISRFNRLDAIINNAGTLILSTM